MSFVFSFVDSIMRKCCIMHAYLRFHVDPVEVVSKNLRVSDKSTQLQTLARRLNFRIGKKEQAASSTCN